MKKKSVLKKLLGFIKCNEDGSDFSEMLATPPRNTMKDHLHHRVKGYSDGQEEIVLSIEQEEKIENSYNCQVAQSIINEMSELGW